MKHILVIDGFIPVHLKLKELGNKLTIITEPGRLKGKHPDLYYRVIQAIDDEKIYFAKAIHKLDKIEVIANSSENRQDITAQIAAELKLPYHDSATIRNIYNKHEMRKILNEQGIDPTKGALASSKQAIMDFITEYGLPVVVKPVDGVGSKGVSIINTVDEVDSALEWYDISDNERGKLYIEQYIAGEEFSVESFTEDGVTKVVSVTKKFKTDDSHCIEIGQCVGAFSDSSLMQNIECSIAQFIAAIGIKMGPAHTEIMIQDKKEIRFIETHCRLGGDNIPVLVNNAFGIDMIELWARQMMGEKIMPRLFPTMHKCSMIYFILPKNTGILQKLPLLKPFANDADIDIEFYKEIGDTISECKDSFSRLGHVIVTRDNYEQAETDIRAILEKLENGIEIG